MIKNVKFKHLDGNSPIMPPTDLVCDFLPVPRTCPTMTLQPLSRMNPMTCGPNW